VSPVAPSPGAKAAESMGTSGNRREENPRFLAPVSGEKS
jgi:hypothetical protein